MPFSTIDSPKKYFDTKLYTGNGSTQSIGGLCFKPDFVWIKNRTNANSHQVFDNVRGVQKALYTNGTDAEETNANFLTAFNSDGFSVGSGANVNGNASNVVAWNFLGANTTTSNTSGTISSTVSANTTAGFSIVSYTGNGSTSATVGHGLGVTPAMIIIKNRSAVSQWMVKHKSLATDYNLQLNVSDAQLYLPTGTGQGGVGNLSSSSTFGFTSGTTGVNNVNNSGSSFIAYCFAEVKGFSKAFSYVGNGSSDGTFVHLGFRPAFVILKSSSSASGNWLIQDNKRLGYNASNSELFANLSNAEGTYDRADFLSNGFKARINSGENNSSGVTYVGFAVAESPFVSSKGVPVCAR